jgi:hypothetical protein
MISADHILQYLKNTEDTSICNQHELLTKTFSKKYRKIIVFTKDNLGTNSEFLPHAERPPTILDQIISVIFLYPEFEFTVVHNCLNIPDKIANISFICCAPEWITNSMNNYIRVAPQSEKLFAEPYFWLSLNNNSKVHRYLTTMFLLGNSVENHGLLRFDPTEVLRHESWQTYLSWWAHNERSEILDIKQFYPVLEKGFDKIKNSQGFESREYTKTSTPPKNGKNFDQHLRKLCMHTAVEIVNETIWFPDPGGIVSEKYLNSVYGFNFPVIISVSHTVTYLRKLGFDMFDDIIDHSYDTITSPTIRLVSALNSNLHLLKDRDKTISAWQQCQARMHKNVKLAKDLEKYYKTQSWFIKYF